MSAARFYALGLVMGASAVSGAQSFPWFVNPVTMRQVVTQAMTDKIMAPTKTTLGDPSQVVTYSPKPGDPPVSVLRPEADTTVPATPASTRWIDRSIFQRLKIVGNRRLGFHSHQVEGDFETFNSLNYYGRGSSRFTDTGQINVSGNEVLGFLSFDLAYSTQDLNDPNAQRVTLSYKRGPVRVSAGDISGRLLNTNPYATFSRSLKGASLDYTAGRTSAKVLHTEAKGSSRTISLQGNNSVGPYYLQSGRIIPDTIEVRVDGRPVSLVDDYVVNADIGAITFVSEIIPPTSSIVVTYESYGIGTQGTIQGAGLAYDLGKYGRLGLTGIEQRTGVTGLGNTIVQRFFGYGSAGAQYWLDYEPLPGSVVVKVDGILQIEGPADGFGGDYYFDPQTPFVLYFKRPIPTNQQIDVIFRPRNIQNLDGDRRVWGFDYRLPLGKADDGSFVQYSQASGQLMSQSNPMSGTARGLDGQYKLGSFTFRGGAHDIPRQYVSVESRGFQRNEKATEIGVDWSQGRYSASATTNNSSISTRETSDQGIVWDNARYTRSTGSLSYLEPSGASWNLSHSIQRNRYRDETQLDTTAFGGKRRFGKIDTEYGFQYQTGYGPISNGFTTENGTLNLQTYSLGARYKPGGGLSLGGRAGISRVSALGKTSDGSDYSLNAVYQPESGRIKANLSYAVSDSGQLATLGDFGGGFGYGGNGFTGGGIGTGVFGSGSSSLKALTFIANYEASSRLGFDVHASSSESKGSYRSNNRTNTIGLGADWNLGSFNQLGLSLNRTETSFFGDLAQNSSTLSLDAYLTGAPLGPWFYRLGLSQFVTSNTSLYAQDAFSLDATLGYKLTPRQRLWLQYRNGHTTGLYGQKENALFASYEHQLFQNVSLIGGYKWRNVTNLSQEIVGGSYRSSGFDLELSFDFR